MRDRPKLYNDVRFEVVDLAELKREEDLSSLKAEIARLRQYSDDLILRYAVRRDAMQSEIADLQSASDDLGFISERTVGVEQVFDGSWEVLIELREKDFKYPRASTLHKAIAAARAYEGKA